MPLLHDTNTLGPVNINSSNATVLDYTMPADGHVGIAFFMSNFYTLSSNGAVFTVVVEIWNASSNQVDYYTDAVPKYNSTAPGQRIQIDRTFFLPEGYRIKVSVGSDNVNDTDVAIAGYLFDPICASDLVALSGEEFGDYVGTNFQNFFNNDDTIGGTALDDVSTFDAATTTVKVPDVYHADINVAVDAADEQDEYTVTWFKNGVRVISDISDAEITVVNRTAEALLLDAEDLDEITGTGILKFDSPEERIEPGNAYVAIATATIDNATRTFSKVVGRDSAA